MPGVIVRSDGRAAIKIKHQWVYLGGAGSEASEQRYRTLCAVRRLGGDVAVLRWSVADLHTLCDWYIRHAESYYRKRNRPTKTVAAARRAFELMRECGPTDVHPERYGPADLKNLQRHMCRLGLAAKTINEYAGAVVRMFEWAAGEELVGGQLWQALRAVKRVQPGRSPDPSCPPPPGPRKRRPVPDEDFAAVLAHCSPTIADMARLERLTAMRPEEVCYCRWCDIKPVEPGLWIYTPSPEANKLDHKRIERTVYMGPEAIAILERHRDGPLSSESYVFSPRRAEEQRNAARRASRATPLYPAHVRSQRKRRRSRGESRVREHYDTNSYARAIARAVAASGLPESQAWTPGRLRHTGASFIANSTDLETARELLGHADVRTTMGYVTLKHHKAAAAARKLC